jgi:hypothetical protein
MTTYVNIHPILQNMEGKNLNFYEFEVEFTVPSVGERSGVCHR